MAIYVEPTRLVTGNGFRRNGDKHIYSADEIISRAASGTLTRAEFETNYTAVGRIPVTEIGRIYTMFGGRENWGPLATLPGYERRYVGTMEEIRPKENLNAADITYVYIVADDDGNFTDDDVISTKEFERIKKLKDLREVKVIARFKNVDGEYEYIGDGKSIIPKKLATANASDDDDDDVIIDTADSDADDDASDSTSTTSSDKSKKVTIKTGKDEHGKSSRFALFVKATKMPTTEAHAREDIRLGTSKEEDFGYAPFTEFDGEICCIKNPKWDEYPAFKAKKKA